MSIEAENRRRRRNRKKARQKARKRFMAGVFLLLAVMAGCTVYTQNDVIGQFFSQVKAEVGNPGSLRENNKKNNAAKVSGKAEKDNTDWQLRLVNQWNPLPDDFEVELEYLRNNQAVDARIYPELQEMFNDARAVGLRPEITSSFRTRADQQEILDDTIQRYRLEGYSETGAKKEAKRWVAIPGTSEHELGLAVDITAENGLFNSKDDVWRWLESNCYKYGFILRYPEDKAAITGISHEQWHFRYVGQDVAEEIHERGICLEEYLENK